MNVFVLGKNLGKLPGKEKSYRKVGFPEETLFGLPGCSDNKSRRVGMLRLIMLIVLVSGPVAADQLDSSAGPITVTRIVEGLSTPWAIGIVPGEGVLITERDGELLFVSDGKVNKVKGVPKVAVSGQGGLLDVTIPRDFAQSREIFLTFSKAQFPNRMHGLSIALARHARGEALSSSRR